MSIDEMLQRTDIVYDKLKQLKPETTYIGGFNQRMREVYSKNDISAEVVYGVEFMLLWQSLDSIITQFNNIVTELKQTKTKGEQ